MRSTRLEVVDPRVGTLLDQAFVEFTTLIQDPVGRKDTGVSTKLLPVISTFYYEFILGT